MGDIETVIIYTSLAGACIPLGGALAKLEHIRPAWMENEFRHFIIAFGGGVLLAAVTFILVPEGMAYVSGPVDTIIYFLSGGIFFFLFELISGLHRRESPQMIAMLLDYVPESLALGGVFAAGSGTAPLLALFIGLQNLPESFNVYRELIKTRSAKPGRILFMMCLFIPLGPVFGLVGWMFLSEHVYYLGAIMLFASGGILYLIFQDIAPQSKLKRHWAPPLGAIFGFSIGMAGRLWINGT
jgi:ZIP family zinc transporter